MSSTLNEYGGPAVSPSHFSMSERWSGAWLVCCAAVGSLIACGVAIAQPTTSPAGGDVSLAEVVPNSVGIFVEIDRLVGTDHAGRSPNARKLYEMLVGSTQASSEWSRFAMDSLGFTPGQSGQELFSRRFAVAATSWKTLSDGMIVISLIKDDPLLDDAFAPYDNGDAKPSSSPTAIYKTKAGLSASTNGHVLIIAQQDRKGSLFEQAVRLMGGSPESSLGRSASFRRQTRTLPPGRAGLVYLDWTENVADFLSPFDLRRAAVGLYFDADRVELVVRAVRSDQTAPSPPGNTDRLRRLPQTTLAAWCTRVDVARAFEAVVAQSTASEPRRFLDTMRRVLGDEGVGRRIAAKLGPDAVIVWDQHLGPGSDTPQLAILLEAADAEQSAETIATALQAVANWLDLESRDRTRTRPQLRRSDYLVTTIYELSLPTETHSGGILVAPAFAAVDDMFVIALSADHIRNIVDAHFGFAPPLGDLSESWMIDRHTDESAMRIVAQPAMAMQVVDQWLTSPDGSLAGWMSMAMGGDRAAALGDSHAMRVGIGTRPGEQPGTVQVGRVDVGGRADGLLQPGDKIQGLNGYLLALTDPTADLRRRLALPTSTGNWTFRVQRGAQIVDVIVPAMSNRKASKYAADPAGALRSLQELLRPIDFVVASVIESGPNELAAKLTLRFSQP